MTLLDPPHCGRKAPGKKNHDEQCCLLPVSAASTSLIQQATMVPEGQRVLSSGQRRLCWTGEEAPQLSSTFFLCLPPYLLGSSRLGGSRRAPKMSFQDLSLGDCLSQLYIHAGPNYTARFHWAFLALFSWKLQFDGRGQVQMTQSQHDDGNQAGLGFGGLSCQLIELTWFSHFPSASPTSQGHCEDKNWAGELCSAPSSLGEKVE